MAEKETVTVRDLWANTEVFWNVLRGGDTFTAAPRNSSIPGLKRSSTNLQARASLTPRSSLTPVAGDGDAKKAKVEAARQVCQHKNNFSSISCIAPLLLNSQLQSVDLSR